MVKVVKVDIKFGTICDVVDTALYELPLKIFKFLEPCFIGNWNYLIRICFFVISFLR